MTITTFKNKLKETPQAIEFSETMAVIDENYEFTPAAFKNGTLQNKAGENSGSCKILAFAKLQDLSKDDALACFGQFYFKDVLKDPNGEGHQNIRNFMKTGFGGLSFEAVPLKKK
ncbi:HopJ type III effector protein [Flavobacteriaceae bacterium GSB9]|nr:HopJ type III effector protein [Flavobacteriaceae bacterium GSB9]